MSLGRWRDRLRFVAHLLRPLRDTIDPHRRMVRRLRRTRPGQLMQPSPATRDDRYPVIFDFVRTELAGVERPRLLSFGCSTGEEVFTLRRYFPTAEIVGVDINPRSIAIARARLAARADDAIAFQVCGDPGELQEQDYDAIFCMAVLRHGDLEARRPEWCDDVLPFAWAEALATRLAARVRPGGYLALWHVHFRFVDMAVSEGFEPALRLPARAGGNQPLYGPDNRLLEGVACDTAVFRRRA